MLVSAGDAQTGSRIGQDGGRHCCFHSASQGFPQACVAWLCPLPGDRTRTHRRRVGKQSGGRRASQWSVEDVVYHACLRRVATVGVASAHLTAVLQGLLAQLSQRNRNQPLPAGVRNFRVSIDVTSLFPAALKPVALYIVSEKRQHFIFIT